MKIPIKSIKINHRIREDAGNVENLKKSMSEIGLITPIIIDQNKRLLAGYRRLVVAQSLGWQEVEVYVINVNSQYKRLLIEIDDNYYRKELSTQEIIKANQMLKKIKNPNFIIKFFRAVGRFFTKLLGFSTDKEEVYYRNKF